MGIIPALTVLLLILHLMGYVPLHAVFIPLLVWAVFALISALTGSGHWRRWW